MKNLVNAILENLRLNETKSINLGNGSTAYQYNGSYFIKKGDKRREISADQYDKLRNKEVKSNNKSNDNSSRNNSSFEKNFDYDKFSKSNDPREREIANMIKKITDDGKSVEDEYKKSKEEYSKASDTADSLNLERYDLIFNKGYHDNSPEVQEIESRIDKANDIKKKLYRKYDNFRRYKDMIEDYSEDYDRISSGLKPNTPPSNPTSFTSSNSWINDKYPDDYEDYPISNEINGYIKKVGSNPVAITGGGWHDTLDRAFKDGNKRIKQLSDDSYDMDVQERGTWDELEVGPGRYVVRNKYNNGDRVETTYFINNTTK